MKTKREREFVCFLFFFYIDSPIFNTCIQAFRSIFVFRARLRHESRVFGVSALCPYVLYIDKTALSIIIRICMSTCWTRSRIELHINCLKGNKPHGITTAKTLRNTAKQYRSKRRTVLSPLFYPSDHKICLCFQLLLLFVPTLASIDDCRPANTMRHW